MWTPKRVMLLAVGFVLFSTAYIIYAHFLGGINGLPPLPEAYSPIATSSPSVLPEVGDNGADRKLLRAFGPDCDEVNRNIKVELQSRGMVFAAQDMKFENGRVKLRPFSLAMFGKEHDGDKAQEINTVKCDEATLTFDKPVNNIAEMGNNARKITGAELSGEIYIINNRGTPQRDDDLSLYTQGPLYYDESLHRIWTAAVVKVMDLQSKPKPMVISGTRMHLYLAAENQTPAATKPSGPKIKSGSSTRVERIELESDVEMNLWVDPRSGFLGGAQNDKAQEKTATAGRNSVAALAKVDHESVSADKAKVVIRTQGPFRYELLTDRATFDISHHSGPRPNVVQVDRHQEVEEKHDHLECDHLEIQFQRKNSTGGQAVRDEQREGLEMVTVHATGKEVVLSSDAEVLEAHGTDLFYDKRAHLSILKGQPSMWALKEGNEIEAPELQLLDVKGAQQATALGEGYIRMLDKKTGDRPQEAHWKTKFVYGKDGGHDLLTLIGDASFVDHEHAQKLQAQSLQVWLQPSQEGKPSSGSDPQRPLPHHVVALGQVKAFAPDLRVHDTEHLEIWFKDVPPAATPLPDTPPVQEGPPGHPVASDPTPARQTMAITSALAALPPGSPRADSAVPLMAAKSHGQAGIPREAQVVPPLVSAAPASANTQDHAAKPKKPIDISARHIEAHIRRTGPKNELDKVWCEGTVQVVQEPSPPDDKGVDIRGEKLNLVRQADGNILTVLGNYAQVQLDKLYIVGPEINIDQTTNEVEVNGLGTMRLPNDGSLSGTRSTQPGGTKPAQPADLTITWVKHMFFEGQKARFDWPSGPHSRCGVRAQQNSSHMACKAMEVTLDRKISLREGDKGKQQAKVQNVVCDQNVWAEDVKREGNRVVAYQRIECPELSVDNDEEKDDSVVIACGPGMVRMFQLGTKGEMLPSAESPSTAASAATGARASTYPPQAKDKGEGERKLTLVTYQSRMYANNKQGIARFFDKVVVIHVPADNPYLQIDENHPPAGYLFMTCENLEVRKNKLADGKTYQEMRASKKVAIEAQEFSGTADVVKYDESKEQVILEGSAGSLAVLIKQKVRGGEWDEVRGKKIIYWRSTGNYRVEDGRAIRVAQ